MTLCQSVLCVVPRTLFDGGDAPLLPSVVNLMNLVFIIYVRNTGGVEMMKKWRTPLFVCSRFAPIVFPPKTLIESYGCACMKANHFQCKPKGVHMESI